MTATDDPVALSTRKRRLFWLALAAIPVLFFALLEGGLRLFSYGEDIRLFSTVEWEGTAYYAVNPGVVRRYFSDPDFGTYVSRDRFLVHKPPGTYRIFFLGASTTVGFPYLFNGAYSSLLRDRLYVRFPERRVEVVNVGITAVNSYTVADLTREVLRYEPDLLVVYMGHNEFYGALGVGSSEFVGSRRWVVRLYLALQHSRVFELLRDGYRAAGAAGRAARPAGAQLMERMARERAIPYGSPLYERAKAIYRANYEDVIDAAQARGVPVLISTLASNLRDQPPFVSVGAEGLAPDRRARVDTLLAQGRRDVARGAWAEAAERFREAVALDSGRADAHFGLARSEEALGRYDAARDAYRRARDLDALRFRADSDFNEVVRSLAREKGVPLVDMDAVFAAVVRHGLPGDSLFWEHVHPTLDGYLLMADAFAQAMARHGLLAPPAEWAARPDSAAAFYRRFAGVTDFDLEVARMRIDLVKGRWPFRDPPVPFVYEPQSPMQQVAWDYLRHELGWGAAHDRLAKIYGQVGDAARAADELWAVAKVTAYDAYFAVTAADLDASSGRFDRAIERYTFALHVEDAPLTRAKLGTVYLQLGQYPQAVEHLNRALGGQGAAALDPQQRARAHALLARAYLALGDTARAAAERAQARPPQARPPQARPAPGDGPPLRRPTP